MPIYFIEDTQKTESNSREAIVSLFNASLFIENNRLELQEYFHERIISDEQLLNLTHSRFISFNQDSTINNENNSYVAKYFICQNTALRTNILKNQLNEFLLSSLNNTFSYHINVGHGNCSLVVDAASKNIVLIDCGDYDYLQKVSYTNNINECLEHIKNKFNILELKIKHFIITHPHFDHYSGLAKLIRKNIIDKDSIGLINLYYSMTSPTFNQLLQEIKKHEIKIIEPLQKHSSASIDILHPSERVVRTANTIHKHLNPIIEPNPNNTSIVFKLNSESTSFMFTGDIETDGWNRINTCMPYLKKSNYFSISHHGSINGHLRNKCPVHKPINNLSCCAKSNITAILMGRHNAYNGVPANQVINDFKNIIYSEKSNLGHPTKFVEIEWNSKTTTWY